jgi:hypothetical protein
VTGALARPRRGWRLWAVLRVLALFGLCSLISLWALLRATQASAADVLAEISDQLMRLPDARYGSSTQQLWINGLSLNVQSGSSDKDPLLVTQQFRAACAARSAMQLSERESAALAPLKSEGWFESMLDGVAVNRSDAGTSVICIDAMNKPWDVLSIAQAARRFVSSGELLELGRLRYALVRSGSKGGSVFLTLWTDGSARLLEQFPRDRDAPGVDFPDVARVAGSQRFLSARLADSVLATYAHREGSLDELSQRYRDALRAGGYAILDRYVRSEGHLSYNLEKGPRHVQLTLAKGKGLTLATLMSQP